MSLEPFTAFYGLEIDGRQIGGDYLHQFFSHSFALVLLIKFLILVLVQVLAIY